MTAAIPILGITMGDPAGIGPEIIVKALGHASVSSQCRPLVIGDASVIEDAVQLTRTSLNVKSVDQIERISFASDSIAVLDLKHASGISKGVVSREAGDAAFQAIRRAIELAMARQIDAVVTAPINKEAIHLAGHNFPGHTEIFAHFTRTPDYTMMLAEQNLRIVHVSTHVSLRQACDLVRYDRVLRVIQLAHDACRQLGIERPKVGVAGLNPHAGDGGLFGSEEREQIIPAVQAARGLGIEVEGPLPADTFFAKAMSGVYDICVAMYHDQGHIPLKIKGFNFNPQTKTWQSVSGINVTLGLPIIRTSVDHGTAFDQAGKGTASEISLLNAIEYAAKMAVIRNTR